MSEARQGRFEIDLDEIEKQLRRSVEAAPPPKNDPLAELARIVGQDDPFRGIFAEQQAPGLSKAPSVAPARAPSVEPGVPEGHASAPEVEASRREADAVLHGEGEFDPVGNAYGSLENAIGDDDFRPLSPRRSRKRLLGVGGLVVVLALGTAGTLAWRKGGKFVTSSGAPPIIQADNAPLKVAPENPGGMEIPNQNKQIYERGAPESQARVVDRREQPIDVQEAARSLPPAPAPADTAPSPAAQPNAVASADVPRPGPSAEAEPAPRSARQTVLANALGEPRRVRTVSVRPDGTLYDSPPAPALSSAAPSLVPAQGSLPPPVQVATIPISLGTPTTPGAAGSTMAALQSAAAPAAEASDIPATARGAGPAISVLPPERPRATATPATQVANVSPAEQGQAAAPAASTTRSYSVQLGYRSSEQDARSAATQLRGKYAGDLGGRSPSVVQAEVSGKTIFRVRVGPMSKDEAGALCTRLKASGGQCFVAFN